MSKHGRRRSKAVDFDSDAKVHLVDFHGSAVFLAQLLAWLGVNVFEVVQGTSDAAVSVLSYHGFDAHASALSTIDHLAS